MANVKVQVTGTTRVHSSSKSPSRKAATATAAALVHINADDSIGTISSQSTPEPVAPPLVLTGSIGGSTDGDDKNTNGLIAQTVKDFSEVAKESYAGLKHWASLPSRDKNKHSVAASPTSQQSETQPQQPWYQTIVNSGSDLDKDATKKALQDLMSPFMACHNASHDVDFGVDQNYNDHDHDQIGIATPPSSSHTRKDYYQHAIRTNSGRLQDEFAQLKERAVFMLHPVESDTVISMDTAQEDEMMQLQRLTSWGTNGTNNSNTSDSVLSLSTTNTQEHNINNPDHAPPVDDDGHVIPQVLLETAQKRRQARRRKRVVRFDYPPISSLRECPRPDPNDLPDLFFTEEELDEIEADRTSTIIADDIEIVAVGSSTKSTSIDDDFYDHHQSTSPSSNTNRNAVDGVNNKLFGNTSSINKLQRKPRSSSPHPARPARGSWDGNSTSATKEADPRLIKGVQIYLRERSTGKGSSSSHGR